MADSENTGTPRWAAAVAVAGLTAVYALSFVLPAESDRVWCALRAATGIPCPLCGMSRAFIRISHGEFAAAFDLHALSPVAYAAGLFLFAVLAGDIVRSKRLNTRLPGKPLRLAAVAAAVFVFFWAIRLFFLWRSGALEAAFGSSPVGRALSGE